MKRISFVILHLFLFYSAFAGKYDGDSTTLNSISISSEYFFGSNSLTDDLVSTYFKRGFISNEMKDVVSKNLSNSNRFGVGFNYALSFRHKTDSLFGLRHSYYQIGFRDVYHIDSKFSKDMFELYFRGNKNYAGKTASLNDFEFNQIFYQQLSFMFGHTFKNGLNKYEFTTGISFNKGYELLLIQAPTAGIFTQESGEYLDLNANLSIQKNDSAKDGKLAFNGFGGSIDFSFKWTDRKKRDLEFSMTNLGFIGWNKKTTSIEADTSFRFEGVDITQLFDFTDSVSSTINFDSTLVEPYLTSRSKKAHSTSLPALVKLTYTIPIDKYHIRMETGIGNLFFTKSLPIIWQNYQYKLNQSHSFGLKLSYGGYSGFNIGLNYELKLSGWKFQLRSDQVNGLLLKNGTAQGAFVSLAKYF